jgi:ABC-2 type transport system ATP-binding protein
VLGSDKDAVAIRTSGLGKVYEKKTVLSDINFAIRAGERCCFVGANGSGKSTLLEILMGLKTLSQGSVEVLGREPSDLWLKGRRVLLMDRMSFPYYAKVREVVWLHAGFHCVPVDVDAVLRAYDLDGNTNVRHLSKGQKQRLALLITFLGDPSLILLDEPTSGLDPQGRLKLWQIVSRKLEERPDRTLLFATHDLAEAERWADRIAVMHQGRLITLLSPEELCRTTIGRRRKLTIVGQPGKALDGVEEIGSVAHLGTETALYTDQPERLLEKIGAAIEAFQIRIENVTVRDAFFRLTGEVPDGTPTLAA